MTQTVVSDWFQMDEEVTHFCGGSTDTKKMNKPKETQVDTTKWFHPTAPKEESEVLVCKACSAEYKPGEPLTKVGR